MIIELDHPTVIGHPHGQGRENHEHMCHNNEQSGVINWPYLAIFASALKSWVARFRGYLVLSMGRS